ncbi:hypothetical protein [Castellaniella sp.]|uniref:hypothetical protein n=1 Tax=Castellaniella sp. TaxID=1955812 RepID=UPI002AFFF8D5|nr:hypothetical protein [Castellaniella sp.]
MGKSALFAVLLATGALAACQAPGTNRYGSNNTSEFDCIAATVGGAVIGGLVGSTIGGGSGKTLATAAGIGGGGYVGNRMGCR